jgi:hypothetical protein
MEKKFTNDIGSENSYFHPTPKNTSCTGGTVCDISLTSSDDTSEKGSYILTYKELRSFPGLETISKDEAENVIKSLYQLSMISYQIFIHD